MHVIVIKTRPTGSPTGNELETVAVRFVSKTINAMGPLKTD